MTKRLILANLAVFGLQTFYGDTLVAAFALWPIGRFFSPDLGVVVGFHLWQLVTSAFLHAGLAHLALNMWALHMFGRDVERALGAERYLQLYVAAVMSAASVQLVVVSATVHAPYPTLGASGGVFGVLLAFGVLYPRRIVTLLFPPIPMPAWLFVALYGVIELANGVFGTQAGVAHFAHLGGMLGASVMLRRWWRRAASRDGGRFDRTYARVRP